MIEHMWTIPCQTAIVDRESNLVSLMGLIEEVTAFLTPVQQQPGAAGANQPAPQVIRGAIPGPTVASVDILSLWRRVPEDQPARGRGRFTIVAPDETILASGDYDVDLTDFIRFRALGRLQTFPIAGPGTHVIQIESQQEGAQQWERVATIPIRVVIAEPPAPEQLAAAQENPAPAVGE